VYGHRKDLIFRRRGKCAHMALTTTDPTAVRTMLRTISGAGAALRGFWRDQQHRFREYNYSSDGEYSQYSQKCLNL
jgi:hypothetical protein